MTHWTDSDSIDVWYCDSDTTVTKCYNVHSPFRLLWYFIICTIFLCISLSWCDPVWSVVCKNPSTNYHRLLLTLLQCFHFFVSFLYKVVLYLHDFFTLTLWYEWYLIYLFSSFLFIVVPYLPPCSRHHGTIFTSPFLIVIPKTTIFTLFLNCTFVNCIAIIFTSFLNCTLYL